jgi:hypothetical protein
MMQRAGLGVTPVNVALGELVERAVGRHRRRAANDAAGVRFAVEDARTLVRELEALVRRLESADTRTGEQGRR